MAPLARRFSPARLFRRAELDRCAAAPVSCRAAVSFSRDDEADRCFDPRARSGVSNRDQRRLAPGGASVVERETELSRGQRSEVRGQKSEGQKSETEIPR